MMVGKALVFLLVVLLPSLACGTTYYARPASGTYGTSDGSDCDNAFDGLADIAGLAAGDTVNINGTHAEALTLSASGTVAAVITWQSDTSCGDGAGVIDASGMATGVNSNGKSHVVVTGLGCYGATSQCLLVSGAAGTNVTYSENTVHDTVGATAFGIVVQPSLDAARFSGIFIIDNTVTDTAYCGIFLHGAVDGARIQRNTVTNAGRTTECHGISVIPARNFFAGGWTDDGGNIYHQAIGAQTYQTTVTEVLYVFWIKTSPFTRTILTQNMATPTAPGSLEYGYSGGNLYVNVGENPAGDTGEHIYFVYRWPTDWEVSRNTVSYTNFTSGEGAGVQADDAASYGRIVSNYLHHNEGQGVNINYGTHNLIAGNLIVSNGRAGINLSNGALRNHVAHNTLSSNGDGTTNLYANIVGTLTSRLTDVYNNNIIGNWGLYANNSQSQVFHDVRGNNIYGYTTKSQNIGCTGGGTCDTPTEVNPLVTTDYKLTGGSTLRRAGVDISGYCADQRARPCQTPPDIGAYQSSSGDPAAPRSPRL